MRKLVLECRKEFNKDSGIIKMGNAVIMITPPLDEDYWIMRIKLYRNQALVAFPKFGLIGVGFAIEKGSWNTNLPYQTSPERLYDHIKINKKYDQLTKERCIEAIILLQAACKQYEKEKAKKEIVLSMNEVNHTLVDNLCGIKRTKRRDY